MLSVAPSQRMIVIGVALFALVAASVSRGAGAAGRQPLPGVELQGYFHLADWGGSLAIRISREGPVIRQVDGLLPGTCRDSRTGRLLRSGRDGAIGVMITVYPNAPVRPNGSFSFTAKAPPQAGLAPHTITMSGTFYGNNRAAPSTGTTSSVA